MKFRVRSILILIYWLVGLGSVFWTYSVRDSVAFDKFLGPLIVLLIAAPISLVIDQLVAMTHLWSYEFAHGPVVGTLFVLVLLGAGHWQWFHFVPYVYGKIRLRMRR